MAQDVIQVQIQGLPELITRLKRAGHATPKALGPPLYRFAEEAIAGRAKSEFVPVVTGNLRSTIQVQPPDVGWADVSVSIGAGGPAAPYALAVHENPRAGRTGGVSPRGKKYYRKPGQRRTYSTVGQWKYLETPALEAAAAPGKLIADIKAQVEELYGRRY